MNGSRGLRFPVLMESANNLHNTSMFLPPNGLFLSAVFRELREDQLQQFGNHASCVQFPLYQ